MNESAEPSVLLREADGCAASGALSPAAGVGAARGDQGDVASAIASDAVVLYLARWLTDPESTLAAVLTQLPWRQTSIRMFGRDIPEPRLTSWHGDAGAVYRYSGRTNRPLPWTPVLADLRDRLARDVPALLREPARPATPMFNSVLANLYRSGSDHMGWHSDDEPELGEWPVIASISLGAARRFQFRRRVDGRVVSEVTPAPGSLILMTGTSQRDFQHRVVKTARPVEARVNLTFRKVLSGSSPLGSA